MEADWPHGDLVNLRALEENCQWPGHPGVPEQSQKLETPNMETRSWLQGHSKLELETNIHSDFINTEKAPTRAFSWLKAYMESKPEIGMQVQNF